MDWNLFWTAVGAIGGCFGAMATFGAVVVALWQTKHSQKKKLKLEFLDTIQLYNQKTGETLRFIGLRISNIGNRPIIVQGWGMRLKDGYARIAIPPDIGGIEKMAYIRLPHRLDIEETIDLQWENDRFQCFLETNKDNIEENRPLRLFVNDSTGKQYCVKTKKKARDYMK